MTIWFRECWQLKVPMRLTSKSPFILVYNQTLPTTGLEKVLISPWLVTLLHICCLQSCTTPQSPVTPRDRRRLCIEPRRLRIMRWYRCIESPPRDRRRPCPKRWRLHIERRRLRIERDIVASNDECFMMFHNVLRVFHDVLLVVHDILRCITMFYICFIMFYYVLWCLTSQATIGDRDASGIATTPQKLVITLQKIARNQRWHRMDRGYRQERDPMLNSVLNGDWSNSVPGRQIPDGNYLT